MLDSLFFDKDADWGLVNLLERYFSIGVMQNTCERLFLKFEANLEKNLTQIRREFEANVKQI